MILILYSLVWISVYQSFYTFWPFKTKISTYLGDDVSEVGVYEPAAVLPAHALSGWLAVHPAHQLRRVLQLHPQRIVRSHAYIGEI